MLATVKIVKNTEMYPLNEWIIWNVTNISIKLLKIQNCLFIHQKPSFTFNIQIVTLNLGIGTLISYKDIKALAGSQDTSCVHLLPKLV